MEDIISLVLFHYSFHPFKSRRTLISELVLSIALDFDYVCNAPGSNTQSEMTLLFLQT